MARCIIRIEPMSSLIDDKIKIFASGLKPRQPVTLEAKIVGEKGEVFESHAHYISDKYGEVDVSRDSSSGGSYKGVEPMGLLWSMTVAPGQKRGLRLMKRDVTKPYNVMVKCYDGHISPNKLLPGSKQPLSSMIFQKYYMADGVKRIPVREGRIRGTLFIPSGDGAFPGVIDLLGGSGGLYEFKAALLASRGFAALALAYFGDYEDLPENPDTFNMDYFEEAADWLSQHPKVLPSGIGVHAISYGTWIALLMASLNMKAVKAVVAISPVITAFIRPFSYKGKTSRILPFEPSKKIPTEEGCIWRNCYPTTPSHSVTVSKYSATTPVENVACPVLLVFGTGDLNVNPEFAVQEIRDRLKKRNKSNLCSVLRYPGAGHLINIEPPFTPLCYASYLNLPKPLNDGHIVFGGDMESHAKAQEDAWSNILRFLRENLPKTRGKL